MYEINITETGCTPRGMKRQANAVNREGVTAMGVYWFRHFREKHFTNAGAAEYGYTPRQGERGRPYARGFARSYTGRKLREKGHTKPLVWSGDSERYASIGPDVRATAKKGEAKGRVILHARGLNRRYPGSPIDMRAELTAVSQHEATELTDEARRVMQARWAAIREQRKQRIA